MDKASDWCSVFSMESRLYHLPLRLLGNSLCLKQNKTESENESQKGTWTCFCLLACLGASGFVFCCFGLCCFGFVCFLVWAFRINSLYFLLWKRITYEKWMCKLRVISHGCPDVLKNFLSWIYYSFSFATLKIPS